jgi:hypothetical protein
VTTHGVHRVIDVGAFVVGEVVEPGGDSVDQLSDASDLLVGRGGFGAGLGVDVGGGAEAFTAAEQVVEVCL